MSRLLNLGLALVLVIFPGAATMGQSLEQTTTARERQSVNITVYNSNLGLVRETRRIQLSPGQIALRFADVERSQSC